MPIFRHVSAESGIQFDFQHLFSTWKAWMGMGLARAWAVPGAVLGALFTQDLFSKKSRASVMFWFSLPAARGTGSTKQLFQTFEKAARLAGCVEIQSAAHESVRPFSREVGYLKHGFRKTETVFTKVL